VNIRLTEVHQSQAELLKDYTIMQEMTLRETVTSTIQFGTPLIKTIDKMPDLTFSQVHIYVHLFDLTFSQDHVCVHLSDLTFSQNHVRVHLLNLIFSPVHVYVYLRDPHHT
jgi:hypothetical protein